MENNIWRFLNKSVQGASHKRKNTPCQDYSLCSSGEDGSPPLVLAVSDGHGGSRYVRSAQGAVFACEAALEVSGGYVADVFTKADDNVIKQLVEGRLKTDIIKRWQTAVFSHAEKNPFSNEELLALGISGERFEEAMRGEELSERGDILAAYGATLLLVVVLENVIICEQIGDGDILFYYKGRKREAISPIETDNGLLGNETTSLCSLKAPFYMRHSVTYLYDRVNTPDLIMLATDGYSNSFSSRKDFLKAPKDYYELLASEGEGFVLDKAEEWLEETSREGSGDDITMVISWRSGLGGITNG